MIYNCNIPYCILIIGLELQPWPERLEHKGNTNNNLQNDTFSLSTPPSPDAMLMSGIQVIFGRFNIAWRRGETKKMVC